MQKTDIYGGVRYMFTVRAVTSPMAYRARAIFPSGEGISGFGNTRPDAIANMQSRVCNYIDDKTARSLSQSSGPEQLGLPLG